MSVTFSYIFPTFGGMKPDAKRRKRRKPEIVKLGNIAVKIYRRDKPHKREKDGSVEMVTYRVWEVEDYTAGRRLLVSFSDHAEAIKKANKIAERLSTGQVTAAQMTNAEAASYGRAVELLKETGVPLELAAAHFAQAWRILGGDKIVAAAEDYQKRHAAIVACKTVPEVVDEYINSRREKDRSPKTIKDLESRCGKFAEDFKVDIASVTTADVSTWLDKLPDISERTRLNYRTKISQVFTFAGRKGYIPKNSNPVDGTEKPDTEDGKVEIFTPEELNRLIAAARPDFQICLALGCFAGLRSSEIQRLTWDKVRLASGFIEVEGRKRNTPSRRLVPVTDNLRTWLVPHAKKSGLIWRPDLARGAAETLMSNTQVAVAEATGDEKAELKPLPWRHNAPRHSFISYRLALVPNIGQVALEAGNSAKTIFKHYRELVTPEAARAWFAILPEAPTT